MARKQRGKSYPGLHKANAASLTLTAAKRISGVQQTGVRLKFGTPVSCLLGKLQIHNLLNHSVKISSGSPSP